MRPENDMGWEQQPIQPRQNDNVSGLLEMVVVRNVWGDVKAPKPHESERNSGSDDEDALYAMRPAKDKGTQFGGPWWL
jgi:hypothetical protein